METVVVACETIQNELKQAMEDAGKSYPVIWIESGLHNDPQKLNARLNEVINQIDQAKRVLLAMGFCGNSLNGLESGEFELVVPRVDDCITLLLGSIKKRREVSRESAAYFLTSGWLKGERNIWVEYQYMVKKYGEESAKNIGQMMYKHYRTLALLDSGVDPIEKLIEDTKVIADTLELEQKVIPGTLNYLKLLLEGPWDKDHFIIKHPGERIELDDMQMLA